jgi:hypothetical protein
MRPLLAAAGLVLGVLALAQLGTAPVPEQALGQQACTGDIVPPSPAPAGARLRFGITPAGRAGALGPPVPVTPGSRPQTLDALRRLRPPRGALVLRLNRFFWSEGSEGFRRFLRRATGYTNRGFPVELQLRYHPNPGQEGRIGRWLRFVRHVTRAFGRNPRVVALQVANEVNFYPIAPDASDSSYAGAQEALVRGVTAAHQVKVRRGYRQLGIGFNWAYRTDPNREATFWGYLRDHGGRAFRRAVDWVGLDAYPGTIFPPTEPPGQEGVGLVAAMSQLRECFMPIAGLGSGVPIHIEENGWPTGPGRSESEQEAALRSMVSAASTYRGNYNVTEYRWFDLRDHNSSGPNFQQHYGLLRDDYSEKPAFAAYRELVRTLGRKAARVAEHR